MTTTTVNNEATNDPSIADTTDATPSGTAEIESAFGIGGKLDRAAANSRYIKVQAGYHGFALIAALALWGAADSWVIVSNLQIAIVFSVLASIAFGIAMAHILHEWSHFFGAYFSGAKYTVKEKPAFLFFDFDYDNNSRKQFLSMSIGGTVGNLIFLALILLCIPLDSAGRTMLLAVGIGMAVYVSVIEFPVIRLASGGKSAMESLIEHFGKGPGILNMATMYGILATIISWFLLN